MESTTGYAELGNQRIAYRVVGEKPLDVVFTFGVFGSFDVEWEDPAHRLFYEQIARYSRLIQFDQRGSGASDPISVDALPPWESFADEIEAVMDAVGSEQAAIIAGGAATPPALMFAATRPERVSALVLLLSCVRYLIDEDYPIGKTEQQLDELSAGIREAWGTGSSFDALYPSRAGDTRLRAWHAKFERAIVSPTAIANYRQLIHQTDARALLPAISVPTLVMHPQENDRVPPEWGKYVADHIEGARWVELPGADVAPYWDQPEVALGAIEDFLTGLHSAPRSDRQLATVVFTDIVDSTKKADELGDRRWKALLDLHDNLSRDLVSAHSGRVVATTGDGVLATFDGPGRAIRSASDLQHELAKADLHIRTGIHTGEVELRNGDIGGIAVHLASRIMSMAGQEEILVSSTVKDLVIGSDLVFADRGVHALKGIEGTWHLYSVVPNARF